MLCLECGEEILWYEWRTSFPEGNVHQDCAYTYVRERLGPESEKWPQLTPWREGIWQRIRDRESADAASGAAGA